MTKEIVQTITVTTEDFERNWRPCEIDETIYTDGSLRGVVINDEGEYTVIRLER